MTTTIAANIKSRKAAEEMLDLIREEANNSPNPTAFWQTIVAASPLPTKPTNNEIKKLNGGESRAFGCGLMKFGKYSGQRIDEIPLDYLQWLVTEQETFLKKLQGYLLSSRIKQEDQL